MSVAWLEVQKLWQGMAALGAIPLGLTWAGVLWAWPWPPELLLFSRQMVHRCNPVLSLGADWH